MKNAPVMERRHFEFVAGVIADMPSFAPSLRAQRASCAASFADAFARDNPRFDYARFMTACDLEKGT